MSLSRTQSLVVVVALAVPLLMSQLLPSSNPDRWSPVALALLVAVGALAGWTTATVRGWIAMAAWVVLGSVVLLATWTDLVLNVAPSILPVDTWRNETFFAIVAALSLVSVGFILGALARRWRTDRSMATAVALSSRAALAVAIAAAGLIGTAGLTAVAFSRTELVLQGDQAYLTVLITEDGIEVTPAAITDGVEYRLVYESRATETVWISHLLPLDPGQGRAQAMTPAEVEIWLSGAWQDLGPRFENAVSWQAIEPSERVDGGPFQVFPSADGNGGVLWYLSLTDALRAWPGDVFDGEQPQAPWPIHRYVVQPVMRP